MFLNFGVLLDALLLAIGAYWCYEMFGRWRSDLADLRELDDNLQKAVIIGLWLITFVVAALVVNFAVGVVAGVIEFVRSF